MTAQMKVAIVLVSLLVFGGLFLVCQLFLSSDSEKIDRSLNVSFDSLDSGDSSLSETVAILTRRVEQLEFSLVERTLEGLNRRVVEEVSTKPEHDCLNRIGSLEKAVGRLTDQFTTYESNLLPPRPESASIGQVINSAHWDERRQHFARIEAALNRFPSDPNAPDYLELLINASAQLGGGNGKLARKVYDAYEGHISLPEWKQHELQSRIANWGRDQSAEQEHLDALIRDKGTPLEKRLDAQLSLAQWYLRSEQKDVARSIVVEIIRSNESSEHVLVKEVVNSARQLLERVDRDY